MAMDLLRHIASSRLPMTITSPADIDKMRVLRAAGLVIAFSPGPSDPAGPERAAQVLALTEKGRMELERICYPDEQAGGSASTQRGVVP